MSAKITSEKVLVVDVHESVQKTKPREKPGFLTGDFGFVDTSRDELVVRYKIAGGRWKIGRASLRSLASAIELSMRIESASKTPSAVGEDCDGWTPQRIRDRLWEMYPRAGSVSVCTGAENGDMLQACVDTMTWSVERTSDGPATYDQLAAMIGLGWSRAVSAAASSTSEIDSDVTHGRTVAPTLAEAAAHDGFWLVVSHLIRPEVDLVSISGEVIERFDGYRVKLSEFTGLHEEFVWRATDRELRLVSWPKPKV